MARPTYPSDKQAQFMLRLPDGMRDRLKLAAESNSRSMNAEIATRLEQSFTTWPKIFIDEGTADRASRISAKARDEIEARINQYAAGLFEDYIPSPAVSLMDAYDSFRAMVSELPNDKQEKLVQGMSSLFIEAINSMPEAKREEFAKYFDVIRE